LFPHLFEFGRFFLPTYGFLVASGVLLGLWMSVRNARFQGIDPEKVWNLGIIVVLCGIVGAKILYIVNDWSRYKENLGDIFSLNTLQAGGVFSGGLVAALLAAAWYIRRSHLPALATVDCFAPGLALGHAIGRLGCFSAGCCYGKATQAWWGVVFTNPLANQLVGTPLGVHLHPTQLIEAVAEVLNFMLLSWLIQRKKCDGQVFGTFMILYGIARFFIEFLRGDPGRGEVFGGLITGTQLISILLVIGGTLMWLRRQPLAVPAPSTR
jgi:phosphatidylglycerol:prolipoprotein diacylglycerol transferase